jgi:hypothetical protein
MDVLVTRCEFGGMYAKTLALVRELAIVTSDPVQLVATARCRMNFVPLAAVHQVTECVPDAHVSLG